MLLLLTSVSKIEKKTGPFKKALILVTPHLEANKAISRQFTLFKE